MNSQAIRQRVLKVLYDAHEQEGGSGEVEEGELARQLGITPARLRPLLKYWQDRGCIRSKDLTLVPPVTYRYLEITGPGMDEVEHPASDEAAIVVEGDL